jgi:hypothetical protein
MKDYQPQTNFQKTFNIASIIFSFIVIIGIVFKFLHLPGASFMLVFGLLGASCLYLLNGFNTNNLKGLSKVIHVVMYYSLSIFIIGFLFMIMHWPGSSIMVAIGLISFILVYILYLYNYFKSEKKSSIDIQIISCLLILILVSTFLRTSKESLKSNIIINEQSEKQLTQLNKISDNILSSLEKNQLDSLNEYKAKKTKEISTLMSGSIEYIDKLKHLIIDETENVIIKDTATLRYANSLDNYDIPTHLLIGDDETKPVQAEYSAIDLRNKLNSLHDNLINLITDLEKNINADFSAQKEMIINLKPVDPNEKFDGIPITWEVYNFYHLPMSAIICRLSQIQLDIKNAELSVLTEIK